MNRRSSSRGMDSPRVETTSGRSECIYRPTYRSAALGQWGRMRMSCVAATGLAGFEERFTLIQQSDDALDLQKNEGGAGPHNRSTPVSHSPLATHLSHEGPSEDQDEQQEPTSTLPNHRLQPWSSNPRHISAILLRTNNLTRLENILDQHSPFLNARHISIALSILPDIADGSRKVSSSSSLDIESIDELKQNGLQSSAHARAKRVRVLSLASRLSSAFGRYLGEYEPRDFAAAARSLGKIECSPPGTDGGRRWIERLLSASLQGEGLKRFQSRELSTFLWGMARIKRSLLPSFNEGLGLEWMTRAKERALEIARHTADALTSSPQGWEGLGGSVATPQGLSVILWSFSNLSYFSQGASNSNLRSREGYAAALDAEETDVEDSGNQHADSSLLPSSWINEYLSVLSKPVVIRSLDSKNVCMSLSALARCSSGSSSYRPPSALVHKLLHRLLSQCSSTPAADERQWVIVQFRRVLAESSPKMAQPESLTTDPRCIVEALWSLAKLGFRPGKDVMSRLCHTSKAMLAAGKMSGREAVILLWSMAVLKAEIDNTWLVEYEQATMQLIGSDFTPQGLSCSVWAMSKLGFRPGFTWIDAVINASQDKMAELGPHSLSLLATALVTLKYTPRPSWTLALITSATRALPEASPLSLTLIAYSIANLAGSFFGKHGRTSTVLSSSSVFLTQSQKGACAAFVDALIFHSGRVLKRQQRESSPSPLRLEARELATLVWSISKISQSASGPGSRTVIVSSSWLHAAANACSDVMSAASAKDASQMLFALTRMSISSPHHISPLVESSLRRLSGLVHSDVVTLQDISNTLWSLATLRHFPQDRLSSASLLDSDIAALLFTAESLIKASSDSLPHDAELAQITWSLVRMTGQSPSLLFHPRVSSLASSLITASQTLFESVSREREGSVHLSLLSAWTLIAGLSRLTFLSVSMASDGPKEETSLSQTSSHAPSPLVLSQEWIKAATEAAAIAIASPRSRNLHPRRRRMMSDGIVVALEQLGASKDGLMALQDLIVSRSVSPTTGSSLQSADWEEPFLRGPLTPERDAQLPTEATRQERALGLSIDEDSDEEHRYRW